MSGSIKGAELSKERRFQLQRAVDSLESCLRNWNMGSMIDSVVDASKAVTMGLESPVFDGMRLEHSFRNTKGASYYIGEKLDQLDKLARSLVGFGEEVLCSTRW